jgi:hypothetical protein
MESTLISHKSLIHLLHTLATSDDVADWAVRLKMCLERLLPTVDRVSIIINRASPLTRTTDGNGPLAVIRIIDPEHNIRARLLVDESGGNGDSAVSRFTSGGFPVGDYRPPHCINYSTGADGYLGSVILWSRITRPQTSCVDLAAVQHLHGLLRFFFVSVVARFQSLNRSYTEAFHSIIRLCRLGNLSRRQRQVLLCRFNGKTIRETSGLLRVPNTTHHQA